MNSKLEMYHFFVMFLILFSIPNVKTYCWEPGKDPGFSGLPSFQNNSNVKGCTLTWFGIVTNRHCADGLFVKYWPSSTPNHYITTKLFDNDVNSVELEMIPNVQYTFQVGTREDKGLIVGIDWFYSDKVEAIFNFTSKMYVQIV